MDISGKGLEKHYFRKRTVRICGLFAGAALAVLLSVALMLDFEPEICLFKHGSVLGSVAFYAALGISVAVIAVTFLLIPKEKPSESVFPEENIYMHYYTAELPFIKAIRFVTAGGILSMAAVRAVVFIIKTELPALPPVLAAVMLMASVPLALYFVPELTEKIADLNGRLHLILGCIGLIYPLLSIMNGYFDKSYTLASQYKTLEQLCFVSVMLAIVYEIRYRMDGTAIRSRIATSLLAFTLCFGFGIGRTVMLMTVGAVGSGDTSITFTLLAFSLYFGSKMFFYEEE